MPLSSSGGRVGRRPVSLSSVRLLLSFIPTEVSCDVIAVGSTGPRGGTHPYLILSLVLHIYRVLKFVPAFGCSSAPALGICPQSRQLPFPD